MTVVKDWVADAAQEIDDGNALSTNTIADIQAIITKHCPMKPDIAYMPVPRCETCAYWRRFAGELLPTRLERVGTCQMSLDPPDRHNALVYGNLETEFDFGCVLWKAKP